jgi:hypothetical protein
MNGGVIMSVEKAKEFLRYIHKNPEIIEKMKGFTHEDIRAAAEELKKEGITIPENTSPFYPI